MIGKDNMHTCLGAHFRNRIVQQGQHFFVGPTSFCDDYTKHPYIALPVYSVKPAMVGPAFARSSTKRVPRTISSSSPGRK